MLLRYWCLVCLFVCLFFNCLIYLFVFTTHGLGRNVLPGLSQLLLRCHLCEAAKEAGEEVLPLWVATAVVVFHQGSGLRQVQPLWIAQEGQLLLSPERQCNSVNNSCSSCDGCRLRNCRGTTIFTGATILDNSCGTFYCSSCRLGWKGRDCHCFLWQGAQGQHSLVITNQYGILSPKFM